MVDLIVQISILIDLLSDLWLGSVLDDLNYLIDLSQLFSAEQWVALVAQN
jgi:hypothetical protein